MQRITISIDEELGASFDRMVEARRYQSRSEGVRDLVRDAVATWRGEQSDRTPCVASLSYIYNRQTRMLPQRLSQLQHEAHDLVVCSTQVHLDHDHTLETLMLRGMAVDVRAFADTVRAERGVRFDMLNLVGVDLNHEHEHPASHSHVGHAHFAPPRG